LIGVQAYAAYVRASWVTSRQPCTQWRFCAEARGHRPPNLAQGQPPTKKTIGSIVILLSRCCLPNDEGSGPQIFFPRTATACTPMVYGRTTPPLQYFDAIQIFEPLGVKPNYDNIHPKSTRWSASASTSNKAYCYSELSLLFRITVTITSTLSLTHEGMARLSWPGWS